MKIYSKTVGREIDFTTFEKEENGQKIRVILHDSLENIIHNEIECEYSYDVVVADTRHSVVICTMSNGMRVVKGVGESIPATLENDIAKNYPTLIATQRAFDRAAIRFLGLESKVFSNTEISLIDFDLLVEEDIIPANEVASAVAETKGVISSVVQTEESLTDDDTFSIDTDDDINEEVIVEDELPTNEVTETVIESEMEEIPVEIDTSDLITSDDDPDSCENYIVTLKGLYAGKNMTLAEVAKVNRGWIEFIASDKFNAASALAKEHQVKCREFLERNKK